jgi:hypothetical protein
MWIDEIERNTHKNSSSNIFSFKRYKFDKIIMQGTRKDKIAYSVVFLSFFIGFANFISFKRRLNFCVFSSLSHLFTCHISKNIYNS